MFMSTGIDGMPGSGGTGLLLANGTWTGVVGDLLYKGLATSNVDDRSKLIFKVNISQVLPDDNPVPLIFQIG